jgi:predicted TIM-barrel fold metal-dependent hydrolase
LFDGQRTPINALQTLAGNKPEEYTQNIRRMSDIRPGAWDPAERIKDQAIDGVDAEILYFGGPLASAKDPALRLNSYRGYNRWLADFSSYAPERLLGMAAIPVDTPEIALAEIKAAAGFGLRGVLMPLFPLEGQYGDAEWDEVWPTLVELELPMCLHVGGWWTDSKLKERPSFYFKRQVFATFMEDPVGLRERHEIGIDNIMWSNDYPHSETTWPNSKSLTSEWMSSYPDEERDKILWRNCAGVYGMVGGGVGVRS